MALFHAQTEPHSGLTLWACICCHARLVSCCLLQQFKFHNLRFPLSGWLITNVQVNIIATLHDTRHTCIYITLVLLLIFFFLYIFHFPGQAGCPPLALSDTVTPVHLIKCLAVCLEGGRFWGFCAVLRIRIWIRIREDPSFFSRNRIQIRNFCSWFGFGFGSGFRSGSSSGSSNLISTVLVNNLINKKLVCF